MIVAAGLLAPGVAAAAEPSIERGVVYGHAPDHRGRDQVLRMDVHRPRSAPPGSLAPAIVWIHGGGFVHGHRRRMEPFAAYFARRGYVAATIDYRLVPHHELETPGRPPPVRAAQHDAQAAIRYLRRHAGRLRIDRSSIYVAGSSAGAMTALNVALHPDDPGASGNGGRSSRVRAVVSLAGFAPVDAVAADAPPMLLLHGTADRTIPFAWAERTCELALASGAACDLVAFSDAGHRLPWNHTEELARRSVEWLALRR
jgi:acetyl esterase/lipase